MSKTLIINLFIYFFITMEKKISRLSIVVSVVVVLLIGLLVLSIYSIPPGYRGVRTTLNKVEDVSLSNGYGFKWPFISRVVKMNIQTQEMTQKTASYTQDVQSAKLDYTFIYELNPMNVHKLYEDVGMDYHTKKIIPVLNGVLKDVVGKWQAQELVSNRDKARDEVISLLQQRIDLNYFQNLSFEFNDIDYSDKFEQSIEDKVIADQKAQEAVNNTRRITEEANQKLISAKADAEAMEIKSAALAKNKGLVEYEWVQKWNGQMPQIVLGDGASPLISLPNK